MKRRVATRGNTAKQGRSKKTKAGSATRRVRERARSIAKSEEQLSEALQRQAATSEVLKIISSSQGELQPVFLAILKNAIRICEAKFGHLVLTDGDAFRMAAEVDMPAELQRFLGDESRSNPPPAAISIV